MIVEFSASVGFVVGVPSSVCRVFVVGLVCRVLCLSQFGLWCFVVVYV